MTTAELGRGPALEHAFDPRRNSFTAMRLVLASMVIFSHSINLGGFGQDWLYRHGENDNFGTLAVAVFFTLSGFLVARSYVESGSLIRYLIHRTARIYPGYWACLAVTAFAFSPVLYWTQHGHTLDGFMAHPTQSPLDYVVRNASLIIRQGDVAAVTGQLIGGGWNVSIWSLSYEFQCYLVLALFGFGGLLSSGRTAVVLLLILLVVARLNTEMPGAGGVNPLLSQYMWSIRLGVNFTIGVLAYLYRDRLTMSWQTALALVIAAELVAKTPMWWVVAPFAVGYLGLYLGSSPRLAFWDKFGDYSYGAYLYGSVVTQALVFYGMNRWGFVPFFLMIVAGVAPLAFLSYRVIELPATHVARRLAAMVSGKRVGPAQSLPSPVSVTHSTEMVAP